MANEKAWTPAELPDPDLRPPDPAPHCDDCGAFLDEGECPVCAEAAEYAAEQARVTRAWMSSLHKQDADDANDARREAREQAAAEARADRLARGEP